MAAPGAWDALYRAGAAYRGPAGEPWFSPVLPPGAMVLDLGCGAGKSLRPLAARGWRVLGVDASRPGLRHARRVAPVAQAEATALPLRAASVDGVRVHFLLGHLEPEARAAAAAEIGRVLRPGGALEVREFAAGDLREGTGHAGGPGTWVRGGIATHYFAPGELAALFPMLECDARVTARAVRFAAQPRRVVELRARAA